MPAKRNCTQQEQAVYRILEQTPERLRALRESREEGGRSFWLKASEEGRLRMEQEICERLMENLDPLERRIMRMRFVEKRTWTNAAMMLGMSERQAQRIQHSAVRRMARACAQGKFLPG